MKNENSLFELSAECLLNYLYPERMDEWKADYAGTFYRNYSPDLLSVDTERNEVRLSRDGFLRLFPQGVIAREEALKGEDFERKYEALKKEKELLRELFKPVDTLSFRFRLHLEREASGLCGDKIALLLKRYFDYDLSREENPYIRKCAPLLLAVSRLRANYGFIRHLLKHLFECEVLMKKRRYCWEEGTQSSQPAITYQLVIPDLDAAGYASLNRQIAPFREFLCEWFIPFDTYCSISVKQPGYPFVLGRRLLLNYNTEITAHTSTQNIDR